MNKENIKKLQEVLSSMDSSKFDMGVDFKSKGKVCLAGLICSEFNNDNETQMFGNNQKNDRTDFALNFIGVNKSWDNSWLIWYLFAGKWGQHPELNTPAFAIERLQKVMDEYEPGPLDQEISLCLE